MIEGLRGQLISILYYSWPTVAMGVIITVLLRISYIVSNRKKFVLHDELLNLCFIIYILCLFYVVTFQDVSWSTHNYMPFKEILRYEIGSALFFKNIFGNVLLFLPFGILIGRYVKTDRISVVLLIGFITSLSIEVIQFLIGRVFDIDDIILNILGAIVGFVIYKLFVKFSHKLPSFFHKSLFWDIVAVLIFGGIIWFLIP